MSFLNWVTYPLKWTIKIFESTTQFKVRRSSDPNQKRYNGKYGDKTQPFVVKCFLKKNWTKTKSCNISSEA